MEGIIIWKKIFYLFLSFHKLFTWWHLFSHSWEQCPAKGDWSVILSRKRESCHPAYLLCLDSGWSIDPLALLSLYSHNDVTHWKGSCLSHPHYHNAKSPQCHVCTSLSLHRSFICWQIYKPIRVGFSLEVCCPKALTRRRYTLANRAARRLLVNPSNKLLCLRWIFEWNASKKK